MAGGPSRLAIRARDQTFSRKYKRPIRIHPRMGR